MFFYTILIMVFVTVFLISRALAGVLYSSRNAIRVRLDRISKEDDKEKDSELNQPLFVRIVRPVLDSISRAVLRITPREFIYGFEKKVVEAGNPFGLTFRDWINIQVGMMVCLPFATAVIGYAANATIQSTLFVILLEIYACLVLPRFILGKRATARKKKIVNSLPDVLDLLTVSVEAGLGLDGALAQVVEKMPGPLADEFNTVLQEMKVGKSKKDALKDLADRVGVQDLTSFTGAIIQADQLGVSIGNVLRIQSEQMRMKRKQRAQELAMKAPIKMLIPMLLFIFPTIFSVIVGPVIIKVIRTLLN